MAGMMKTVLDSVQLSHLSGNFEAEKVTPDIVGKLSRDELKALGVTSRADSVKLRTACINYGSVQPEKVKQVVGAPQFSIPRCILQNLIEDGFLISDVAKLLSVSERTIYRRMQQYNISKTEFSSIDDDDLDVQIAQVVKDFPFCGETMLQQILRQKDLKIQRSRLRDSLQRIDETGIRDRKRGRLQRRVYDVPYPNYVWHIDTNHKLIRWNFIISAEIDGFSRLITYLHCTDNNKAGTMLRCFLKGVEEYGLPNRIRIDKGMENVDIADYMLQKMGPNQGCVITGKSVHNQRVERLWRDVFVGVLSFYYYLFYYMEENLLLDSLNDVHIAALHHVFLPKIEEKLTIWRTAWAGHRLRTVKTSPLRLWSAGQRRNPVGLDSSTIDGDVLDLSRSDDGREVAEGDSRPAIDPPMLGLSEQCKEQLNQQCPSTWTSTNFGIDTYLKAVDIISSFSQ